MAQQIVRCGVSNRSAHDSGSNRRTDTTSAVTSTGRRIGSSPRWRALERSPTLEIEFVKRRMMSTNSCSRKVGHFARANAVLSMYSQAKKHGSSEIASAVGKGLKNCGRRRNQKRRFRKRDDLFFLYSIFFGECGTSLSTALANNLTFSKSTERARHFWSSTKAEHAVHSRLLERVSVKCALYSCAYLISSRAIALRSF